MSDTISEAPVPEKADPETLVLRGSPARVVRFRRGAVIASAALGSTAIVGTAWIALKPASFQIVASSEDRRDPGAKAPADALAGAPKSYGDVPQLGPPLPGDLGRPILEHQRATGVAVPAGPDPAVQAAEAERQRLIAERKAARESGVMMPVASAGPSNARLPGTQPAMTNTAVEAPEIETERQSSSPDGDPGAQRRAAGSTVGEGSSTDINPHALTPAASPWTLNAGSIIAASLITGLNSDLPGLVTAQVTENAYDSATGQVVLIPQGARLIGNYDNIVAYGQSRALLVWQRIILPDGSSIRIDNVPATDTGGYVGLSDRIDRHTWQLLKGVALSTLLGVGTELSFGNSESDLVRAVRESAQQSGGSTGDQLVLKSLNIQPTLKIRPGWPLRVVLHKDVVLRPWRAAGQ